MTSSPFILKPLEGFLRKFIYLNKLQQELEPSRIKGIKGLEVFAPNRQPTFIPFIPLILANWRLIDEPCIHDTG